MKIQNKLFLILFSFSSLLVVTLVLLTQWSLGKGMIEYVNAKQVEALMPVVNKLANSYQLNNSWAQWDGKHSKFINLIIQNLENEEVEQRPLQRPLHRHPPEHNNPHRPDRRPERPPRPPRGKPSLMTGGVDYALLNVNKEVIAGKYLIELDYSQTPIISDEVIVGYFAISKRQQLTQGFEFEFIKQQQQYLWGIGVIVLLIMSFVIIPLSRHIVEPIKLIARGIHQLTQGDYQHSINLKRKDELGRLSLDYNDLAATLSDNETARKRWIANISHELRTPVAILRGEIEAMIDDVRPLTKENIHSANDEVRHLQRLIDDLNQLTSTDVGGMRYQKQNQNINELLANEFNKYDGYLTDAGIKLTINTTIQNVIVYVDKTRLCQLFENIINNAIKYAQCTQLTINVNQINIHNGESIKVTFEDDGIGVEDAHLANLFEYLYRVDDSRNRKSGGAGLGLSICRQIVMAHKGEIFAEKSMLGGLAIIITLPIS